MDFIRSHFGEKQPWPVEHFFSSQEGTCKYYRLHLSKVTSYKIHTLTDPPKSGWGGVDRPPFPKTLLHTMCQITVSKGHLWKIFRFIAQCGKIFFWQDSLISHGLAATSTVADRKIESTNPGMNFFSKDFFFIFNPFYYYVH